MSLLTFQIPASDALRIMNVLASTTDIHFLENNRAHTSDHRNAITAEQRFFEQLSNQMDPRTLIMAKRELSESERYDCVL
jgi:hypothetical protein